jgi:hypothetical protein
MRIVLLIALYILQTGVSIAQDPQPSRRAEEVDRAACMILDDKADKAERYLEIVLPSGQKKGAHTLRPATKLNLNVRIPHTLAAADGLTLQMRTAMRQGKSKMGHDDPLKLALVIGCTDGNIEYVSYRIRVSGPRFLIPIAKGTPFPLEVSACVRTEEGPRCVFGTVREPTQKSIELSSRG